MDVIVAADATIDLYGVPLVTKKTAPHSTPFDNLEVYGAHLFL